MPEPEPLAGPSLKSGFAWSFTGNAINGFSQWAILSLIAKLTTPEVLGQYALGVAVATPIAMLTHLNLRSVLATDVRRLHPFRDYYCVRLVAGLTGVLATAVLALMWKPLRPVAVTVILIGAGLTAENFEDLYYGLMQRDDRLDQVARSMIIRAVLTMLFVAAFLAYSPGAAAAAGGFFAGRLATLLAFDTRAAATPGDKISNPGAVFRSALPLGLALMLVSLTSTIPRYAVESLSGTSELGIFVAVVSFVTVGSTIINALGQSATTRLAKAWAKGQRGQFVALSAKLVGLAVALGSFGTLLAAIGGPFFLKLLYRPAYAEYSWLLVQTLAAGTLVYVAATLGFITTSTRRFGQQLPLLLTVAATSAAASFVAIPRLGLSGAAVALAAAALVQIAGYLLILWKAL